ncbi:MAG: hypothetical protein E7458_07840 [Ruminococcaceae bacterium]|nr:hypothetical protein [Oscillospiraceae bacterium]
MDRMICEQFELDIVDYLDGTLTGERLAALEQHLRSCAACSRLVEEMRLILGETAALVDPVPEELHQRIMERVASARPAGRLSRFPLRRLTAAAAALALLIGVGSVLGTALGGRKDAAAEADMAYMAENAKSVSTYERDGGEGILEAYDDAAPMEVCDEEAEMEETVDATAAADAEVFSTFAAVYRMELTKMPQILQEYQLSEEQAKELLPELSENEQFAQVPVYELKWILEVLDGNAVSYELDLAYEPDAYAETVLFILNLTK